MSNNSTIALDNIIDILIKLPVKSLLRFKRVCKLWRSVIDDVQFINLHHEQCKIDYKNCHNQKIFLACYEIGTGQMFQYSVQCDSTVSILDVPTTIQSYDSVYVNSCSGLFILAFSSNNIVLWNPAIKESRTIPSPIMSIHDDEEEEEQTWIFYGLGYDHSSDDYKIVRVDHGNNVQIFSTKNDSWKLINESSKLPETYNIEGDNMVVADDGVVYMIINELNVNKFILSLCLKNEEFDEILFQDHRDLTMKQPYLFTLGGCLSLAYYNELDDFQVWSMKKINGINSWSIVFAITVPVPMLVQESMINKSHLRPVSFTKDGGMLFRRNKDELVVYDTKTRTIEQVEIAGLEVSSSLYFYRVVTYVETLISPNAL